MEVANEGMSANRYSKVNAYRIAAVIDRLASQFCSMADIESYEFVNLCLSLARGIDYAVANHEIPNRANELPMLLKQVCGSRNDVLLLASLMVLMMSVKNACQSKWFSDRDSEELCGLANQIEKCFCATMDFVIEPSSCQTTISAIMTRFYPRLKVDQILLSLEVKPGLGTYVRDFQISKQISRDDKIMLLVAQTDNTETSSCLVNPQHANFLLNGKGVDRRINVFMDTGPQMPTIVNKFLKYGTNLLQVIGQFNGNYVIVIAVMSELPTMDNPVLQDHVQPAAVVVDPDSEIIEGPSRISLNCPISFKRIKTPVKGHSCKHLQCFDLDNFMDINSKRPSWRCPHCNHHVCFTDIRIDQNMVKVLKDVGKNVNDVIISADGSWKAILESDHTEKEQDKHSLMEDDGSEGLGSAISNAAPAFLDLTEADDVLMVETEDRKVIPNNSEAQGISEVNQNLSLQADDNFWTGVYLSTFGSTGPISGQLNGGFPETSSMNASSPTADCEAGASQENALVALSNPQNEISSQISMGLQPHQLGNSSNSSEYGRSLSTAQYMSRTPVAVQALPAQSSTAVPKRPRLSQSDSIQCIPLRNNERPQLFARPQDSFQASRMASPSFPQNLFPQQQNRQFSSARPQQITGQQASNHVRAPYSSQPRLNLRMPTPGNPSPGISSPQTSNLRMPQTVNQSTGMFRPPVQPMNPQVQLRGSQGLPSIAIGGMNGQQARTFAAQRPAQVPAAPRMPSFPGNTGGNRVGDQRRINESMTHSTTRLDPSGTVAIGGMNGQQARTLAAQRPALVPAAPRMPSFPGNTGGNGVGDQGRINESMTHSTTRLDPSGTAPADPNWRPPGRMRGSLTGRAYDALSQHIIQPTQQTQIARAPSAPIPPNVSNQLQILLANRAALQAAGNPPTVSSMSGDSDALPPSPPEMN